MYYYAYLNEEDICLAIYALPSPISGTQYIAVSSNDQSLVGQHYNRSKFEFEPVYYYAILNDSSIVESVTYFTTQQTTNDTFIAITFAQYQTVVGMYWNGTEFTEPPISALAVASTDEINYKNQEKWLSTKLDEMDTAIAGNSGNISTLATDLATVVTNLQTVTNSLASLNTIVEGKANASHTHTASDLSGVVKTINGTAPDENGNVAISVTGGGMTANEILEALKTVDGTGSGIDADTLDGLDSTAFSLANHNHDSEYASIDHVHVGYVTNADLLDYAPITAVNEALAGKSDTTHNHDTAYAPLAHTHTEYATTSNLTALEVAVGDVEDAVEDVEASLDNKADIGHTHSISDVTGLQSALNGKSDTDHTHSDYLPTSGGTVSGNLNVTGIMRVNGQQSIFDSGTMITLSTNNRETMIAGSKIYSKVQISVSSDERLKASIKKAPTDKLVELVDNLDIKTYNYIGSEEENVGIIAQELIEASPDLAKYFVRTDDEGYYSVKTSDLVFPLIASVQELKKEINELRK